VGWSRRKRETRQLWSISGRPQRDEYGRTAFPSPSRCTDVEGERERERETVSSGIEEEEEEMSSPVVVELRER